MGNSVVQWQHPRGKRHHVNPQIINSLVDGETYAVPHLEQTYGRPFANYIRRLANMPIPGPVKAPRPRNIADVLSLDSDQSVPDRTEGTFGGRLGDRLTRS